MSTLIRLFLNPQFFLSGSNIFLVLTQCNRIEFACLNASDAIRNHSRQTKLTRCATILLYCSIRDWTRFWYVFGFENIRIDCPKVIEFVADLLFSTLESGFRNTRIRCWIDRMHMIKSRIRKEKVRRGLKKYIYSDTCGLYLSAKIWQRSAHYNHDSNSNKISVNIKAESHWDQAISQAL